MFRLSDTPERTEKSYGYTVSKILQFIEQHPEEDISLDRLRAELPGLRISDPCLVLLKRVDYIYMFQNLNGEVMLRYRFNGCCTDRDSMIEFVRTKGRYGVWGRELIHAFHGAREVVETLLEQRVLVSCSEGRRKPLASQRLFLNDTVYEMKKSSLLSRAIAYFLE